MVWLAKSNASGSTCFASISAAQLVEGPGEVGGQFRREHQSVASHRVAEGQAPSMKELTRNGDPSSAMAIDPVADNGMADGGEVHAHLMGASRLRHSFDQSVPCQMLAHAIVGAGIASALN